MINQKFILFLKIIKKDFFSFPDIDTGNLERHLMSPTLLRDSFQNRFRYSPATDLSDKVIHTLRRNLSSYVR